MFSMNRKIEFPLHIPKKFEEERQIVRKFIPESEPQASLSAGEVYKIDTCHLNCQRYVYHYSNPYSKLRGPNFIYQQRANCGIKMDRSPALTTRSIAGNKDRQPTEFSAIRDLDRSPPMVPINSKSSDTSYPLWLCVPSYIVDLIAIGIYAVLNIICP